MASSNFEELFLLGRVIWILVLTLLTLSYITVGLRLWVRYRLTKSAGWDDAAMVATLVSGLIDLVATVGHNETDCNRCYLPVIALSSSSLPYEVIRKNFLDPKISASHWLYVSKVYAVFAALFTDCMYSMSN
jgi:hypothetical protein